MRSNNNLQEPIKLINSRRTSPYAFSISDRWKNSVQTRRMIQKVELERIRINLMYDGERSHATCGRTSMHDCTKAYLFRRKHHVAFERRALGREIANKVDPYINLALEHFATPDWPIHARVPCALTRGSHDNKYVDIFGRDLEKRSHSHGLARGLANHACGQEKNPHAST